MIEISDFSPPLFSTLHPDRLISKKPNAGSILARIVRHNYEFCNESDGNLCVKTPVNMLAALLLFSSKDLITEKFTEYGIDVNDNPELHKPVDLLINQVVKIYNDTKDCIAPYILWKQGCGKKAGVVLTGDLSGVIVKSVSLDSGIRYLVPIRFWNDSQIIWSEYDRPNFFYDIENQIKRLPGNLESINSLHDTESSFLCSYYDLLKRYKYTSQAFFALCRETLPFEVASQMDYDNFYRTYQK